MSAKDFSEFSAGQIKLVVVTEGDEDFLTDLYFCIRREEFTMLGWDEIQTRQFLAMQFAFQKRAYQMQFADAEYLIIRLENEKIGRLIIDRTVAELRLVDVALLPEFRKAGIGSRLIRDLQTEAAEKKLPLTLSVARNNLPALRLYQKLGFQITAEDEVYFSMEWRLDFGF